jgi:hypothetical protein
LYNGPKDLLLVDNAGFHFNPKVTEENVVEEDNDNGSKLSGSEQESSNRRNNRKKNKKKKVKKVKKTPDITLTNIKLVYFPLNTTTHL